MRGLPPLGQNTIAGVQRRCRHCMGKFRATTTGAWYCDDECRERSDKIRESRKVMYKRATTMTKRPEIEPLDAPACLCGNLYTYSSSMDGLTLEGCAVCGTSHPLALRRPPPRNKLAREPQSLTHRNSNGTWSAAIQ